MGKQDSRLYKRLALNAQLKATLVTLGDNGRSETSSCMVVMKDFSKSGAGVYMKTQVPKNSLVKLSVDEINLPPLVGRVVWSGPASKEEAPPVNMPYRIGIDFLPKDDEARENQLQTFEALRDVAEKLAKAGKDSE